MNKTRLGLIALLVLATTAVRAQNKPATIKLTNAPVSAVLAQIEQQTGYLFVYDESDIDTRRTVSVNADATPTAQILRTIFPANTTVKWTLKGRNISLTSRQKANKTAKPAHKRTLSGTVKDGKDGEPLIGAVVRIQGDDKSAALVDVDGNFTINIDGDKKPILEVSYIGYTKREVPVGDLSYIDVAMTGAANTLDEVIVVGSGTQKKVSVTGAISTVSGADLVSPTTTLSRSLGGKIAGIISKQTSGEPGTGAEFYIRGISTFGGKATPLILLDDVEITATDLDHIPAENIESFTVLKDASATAIYGARGANGVMIVTTKGGDYNSKTKINIKVENAFNFRSKLPEFIGGADFMRFYNMANQSRNPGTKDLYSATAIERTEAHVNPYLYPDVNWQDELFGDMAMRQRANLNVSGGGSKAKYYMSLDVQHEDGLQKPDKLYSWNNKLQIYNYTFQNNISYKLTSSTTVSLNMNAQIRQSTGPNFGTETTFKWVGAANPVEFPVYFPAGADGKPRYGSKLATNVPLENPKAALNKTCLQRNTNSVNSVLKLDQDLSFITKGLKLNAWVNWKAFHDDWFDRRVANPYMYSVSVDDNTDPTAEFEPVLLNPNDSQFATLGGTHPTGNTTFEFQGNLNWSRKFGSHDLTAMVLYRMREYRSNSAALPNRNQGVSGRVTYDYDHRYLAEFNFGYNGSERLTKKYRYAFFPAASLGWVVSNEAFWEPISNAITHLKIRGSYGLVGSDDLAKPTSDTYFLYQDMIYQNNLNFWNWTSGDGNSNFTGYGPLIRYYALNNVTWEKSKKLDIGLDFTLFGDLNGTLEYFREDRYDIFMQRGSWPWSLGYGMAIPWANTGKALNQGFEVSLNYFKALNSDLSISIQGNLTYTQNKFIDKDEPNYEYPWQRETGGPLDGYRIEGYIADGLFTSEEEIANSPEQQLGTNVRVGDIKYRDLNGDGKINSDDQTMISKYGKNPRLMYGFGATINWKKWDFGFFFTGTGCRTISLAGTMDPKQDVYGRNLNVFKWVAEHAFNPENPDFNAQYPLTGIVSGDLANNTVNSTYWLRNASYLRLRNLELGWSFKYGRVYVNGDNILCFSGFKVWDPELDGPYKYPLQRTVNVGIQFNL